MCQGFLEKLRDYLSERLKNEGFYRWFRPFEIEKRGPFDREKWLVRTQGGLLPVASITESIDGMVSVYSCRTDKAGDYISECLVKSYRHRFKKAEAKGKEEEEKIWKALDKEKEEAYRDYVSRRNIEKHIKRPYREAFVRLLWFDEVARRISEKYGVKVKLGINEIDCDSGLVSRFDGNDMNEEEKFEEIKKRVEAIIAARKLAEGAYKSGNPPKLQKEYHEKYLEFRKNLLGKYGLKEKKLKI